MKLWDAIFWEAEGVGGGAGAEGGSAPAGNGGGQGKSEDGGGNGAGNGEGGSATPGLVQAAAGNTAPGAQGEGTGGGSDPGGAPAGYWPEGLPETLNGLRGANDRETIEKLTGQLRDAPRPPEKPEDYQVALPEDFTKRFGDLSGDEVMPIWRKVAHKNGLDQNQFNGAISELYAELSEKGLIDEPIDVNTELEKLMPKHGDTVTRKAQASARINGVASNVDGLVTRGVLSKTEGNMILSLAARAEGVAALEKLFKAGGEHGLQGGGQGAARTSVEELKKQMGDERYDTRSPKFDKDFRMRVDREWREAHNAK